MINFSNRNIPSIYDLLVEGVVDIKEKPIELHPMVVIREYMERKPDGDNIPHLRKIITETLSSYIDQKYFDGDINGYYLPKFTETDSITIKTDMKNSDLTIYNLYLGYRSYVNLYHQNMEDKYKLVADIYLLNAPFQIERDGISLLNTNYENIVYNISASVDILKRFANYGNRMDLFYLGFARQIIEKSEFDTLIINENVDIRDVCQSLLFKYKFIDYNRLMKSCVAYMRFKKFGCGINEVLQKQLEKVGIFMNEKIAIPIWLTVILYETFIRKAITDNGEIIDEATYVLTIQEENMKEYFQPSLIFSNPVIKLKKNNGTEITINLEEILNNKEE